MNQMLWLVLSVSLSVIVTIVIQAVVQWIRQSNCGHPDGLKPISDSQFSRPGAPLYHWEHCKICGFRSRVRWG